MIIFKTAKVVFWNCGNKPEVFLSQIWQYSLTNNYSQLRETLVMTHQLSLGDIRSAHKGSLKGWHLHWDSCFQHNASLGNETNKLSSHLQSQ